jgi:hypothetical protein
MCPFMCVCVRACLCVCVCVHVCTSQSLSGYSGGDLVSRPAMDSMAMLVGGYEESKPQPLQS